MMLPMNNKIMLLGLIVGSCLLQVIDASSILLRSDPNEKEFEIIPNPHYRPSFPSREKQNIDPTIDSSSKICIEGSSLDSFLEPYYLIRQPMVTQEDTFQEMVYAKVLGVPVPTYVMKQPERLSQAQLGFQMILVKDLSVSGKSQIRTAAVEDMEKAKDSWFPGYYWTPLYLPCGDAEGETLHVGWKFTAYGTKDPSLPFFYALMVRLDPKRKGQEASKQTIAGFRAPGWIRSQLRML